MVRPAPANPVICCSVIICLIYMVILFISPFNILITFLVINPKPPIFDISHANLSSIQIDTTIMSNMVDGEFAILANFSNPNKKLNVKIEHAFMELQLEYSLKGNKSIQPFSIRHEETEAVLIKFVFISVHLPKKCYYGTYRTNS